MALNKLSDAKVRSLKEPGRYSDGGGLYIYVDKAGSKRWLIRFTIAGKTREMGLGSATVISLAEARKLAEEPRRQIKSGVDPLDQREAEAGARVPTFYEMALDFIEQNERSWKNPVHRRQWRQTIEDYCGPINKKPVDEVTTKDIVAVLKPIWATKNETAARLRGRIENIIDAARVLGHIEEDKANPARWKGHLDKVLPAQKKSERGHHAALDYRKMPAFIAKLRKTESVSYLALEFTILTAARTGETIGAQWDEIDLEERLWTVPAVRMKAGKKHIVPLCDRVVEIVEKMMTIKRDNFVFPGRDKNKGLSNMSMSKAAERMGYADITVHGMRSTFRDWCGDETSFPREVAEAALAHTVGGVEGDYRRSTALKKRAELMAQWCAFTQSKIKK